VLFVEVDPVVSIFMPKPLALEVWRVLVVCCDVQLLVADSGGQNPLLSGMISSSMPVFSLSDRRTESGSLLRALSRNRTDGVLKGLSPLEPASESRTSANRGS